ncbi:hypothetical protein [Synechococcus sp. SynAce01]|nr:hypothetical protein [Synechococcus sp. SynAce01]
MTDDLWDVDPTEQPTPDPDPDPNPDPTSPLVGFSSIRLKRWQ